jgi:thiol-disulfide isomerase/thioredoxin
MFQMTSRKTGDLRIFLTLLGIALLTIHWAGCTRSEPAKGPASRQVPAKEAESPASPEKTVKKLETGRAVLEAMAEAYRSAKSYSDKGLVRIMAEAGDQKIDHVADFSVAFKRPNKLRMEVYEVKLVIDGKKMYAAIEDLPGQVLEKDAPAELTMKAVYCDPILTAAASNGFAGALPQVLLLLDDKAVDVLLRDAEEPKLVEPGTIEGRECFRVQIRLLDGLAVFWIDKETLVLRRMLLPTDDLRRQMEKKSNSQLESLSLVADFPGAQLNGPVDSLAFRFEAPEGAEIVSYFIPPHPEQLLGKKTPEFTFFDLDGKPVTAQSLAGKIAVLDFWATSCAPCKASLPELQKVYEKYRDNDKVAFLAVSLDEPQVENTTIADFWRELKLDIPVYRDPEESAVNFNFSGIPSSFIIDAKGIVQDYEAGVDPGLAQVLPEKIDKLLAGEEIYEAPLKRYQEELKQYEKFLTSENQEAESGAQVEERAIPQAKIAEPSEPHAFKLSALWKCVDLKAPGNILVFSPPSGLPRLLVIESWKSVAEVGLDGKVIARHTPKIGDLEVFSNIRSFTAAAGKTYFVVFASAQQRCHLLDENWNPILSFPEEALENPHSGIGDVQLGDLEGDGTPKLYVSYWGLVGVQAVTLEGKRIWSNRSISNVNRIAITDPDANGRRNLLCANSSGSLVALNAKGQREEEIAVPNRMIYWIVGGDLQGEGKLLWCGLSTQKLGENTALGFNLNGKELWSYALPVGVQPQPIEPIIAGKISRQGPGQWILPGPDGSINIISADGKPFDNFNYGATLQGLATVEIDGLPALIVASPNGLEAWKVEAN